MRWWGWGEGGVRQKRPPDESKRLVGCCLTWVGDEKATQRVVMTRWVWFEGCARWWGKEGTQRVLTTRWVVFDVGGDEKATQRVITTRWVRFEGWTRWWGGVGQKRPPDESKRLVGCCLTWVGDEKATQRVITTRWVCFEVVGDEKATQRVTTRWVWFDVGG